MVKLIVELHDGSVSVFSEGPLCGTEFRVTLPTCPPGLELESADLVTPEPFSLLVVEDNEDFARSLERQLQGAGHKVQRCADGPAALVALENGTPEAILCDLGLPNGMDGYQLLKRIKALPRLEGVPVLAMSGYGLAEDKDRSSKAGFAAHLTKPFELDDVHRILGGLPRPACRCSHSGAAGAETAGRNLQNGRDGD